MSVRMNGYERNLANLGERVRIEAQDAKQKAQYMRFEKICMAMNIRKFIQII